MTQALPLPEKAFRGAGRSWPQQDERGQPQGPANLTGILSCAEDSTSGAVSVELVQPVWVLCSQKPIHTGPDNLRAVSQAARTISPRKARLRTSSNSTAWQHDERLQDNAAHPLNTELQIPGDAFSSRHGCQLDCRYRSAAGSHWALQRDPVHTGFFIKEGIW